MRTFCPKKFKKKNQSPKEVHWCDGSQEEADKLFQMMVDKKMAIRLNQEKRPGCYLFRSDKRDVARVESKTFICSEREEYAPGARSSQTSH